MIDDRETIYKELDVAQAIGLIRQLRASADILAGSADTRRLASDRLVQLLEDYDAVIGRLAQIVEREAPTIRQKLDALEPLRTPLGEPDDSGPNALVNATIDVRDMVERQANGDLTRFAQLVAQRVSAAVSYQIERLRGAEPRSGALQEGE